jgi:hypothetical protein
MAAAIPGALLATSSLFPTVQHFVYDYAIELTLAAGVVCLCAGLAVLMLLRRWLNSGSAPQGFWRDVLDLPAMMRWHPCVYVALIGLLVLPGAWYCQPRNLWVLDIVRFKGWRAFSSGDMQQWLQGLAVIYQFALAAGLSLLFALHMLSRWKPKNIFLTWALVPVLFVGSAIGVVVIVTLLH